MKLSDLHNGESAIIVKVHGHGGFRKRITEMGFIRGRKVSSIQNSPLKDPVKYSIMGYEVSLRHSEAEMIDVLYESEVNEQIALTDKQEVYSNNYRHDEINDEYQNINTTDNQAGRRHTHRRHHQQSDKHTAYRKNIINIALVGNPNSGKTSLFNALSGKSEHVGNYGGVTVDAKTGHFNYNGYHFNITDLPGAYSLSAYSPEEKFVRRHLYEKMPDVIVNSVVASNIERNLYMTTELIDLNPRMVVALNMYDELQASGAKLDHEKLSGMIGIPMIPTVAKSKIGLNALLDVVIDLFEGRNQVARHIHINYGTATEPEIPALNDMIRESDDVPQQFPARYWAIKLMEHDSEVNELLSKCADYGKWKRFADKAAEKIKLQTNNDVETAISDAKYGFISGALQETYIPGTRDLNKKTRDIDKLVANKWLGFPIFIFFMWVMFMATFFLGAYPQDWIDTGVRMLGDLISSRISDGPFKDLLVDGIIGGVGSVIVFLPNILILYLFISLMEDSGYMARAAFIMDKIMHKMGLHGKSFIPLIMGFGCNVPAIMATRTIESYSSRLITILINPFMSCSARIPVFILFCGAFFPNNAGTAMISMYLTGILVAILTAKLFRKIIFKVDETPFVMELPPYRIPTLNSTLRHMWDKARQYLKKMGGIILVASIIIWFLSYYPRYKVNIISETAQTEQVTASEKTDAAQAEEEAADEISETAQTEQVTASKKTDAAQAEEETADEESIQYEQSFLGRIGKFCEPVMRPLGLNWRATVALLSGTAAKEIGVSTLGILYHDKSEETLSNTLIESGDFTQRSALSFMVFILLYFPCIATLAAIKNEAGKKWALFTIVYNTALAWSAAFAIYAITGFL
ncbi:MAG: ferrous iron transport protein B [Tannerella sp.]|jgi:ferrous iron transport protein B|nr:ferrous iron transport protein B [Tannerella sp.]